MIVVSFGVVVLIRARGSKDDLFLSAILTGIVLSEIHLLRVKFEYEILLIILSIGIVFGRSAGRFKAPLVEPVVKSSFLHYFTFLAFMMYMAVESLRGALYYWRGINSLYWPLLFSILGIWAVYRRTCQPLSYQKIVEGRRLIIYATCIYLAIFLGLEGLAARGLEFTVDGRQIQKTVLFFPLTITIPVVFLGIRDGAVREMALSIVTLIFAAGAILIASSRGALPSFFLTVVFGLVFIGARKGQVVVFLSISLLILGFYIGLSDVTNAIQTVIDTVNIFQDILYAPDMGNIRDLDRVLHCRVAWDMVKQNGLDLLFGVGFRAEGRYMASELENVYAIYLSKYNFVKELGGYYDVATFGFSSMLAGLGVVGIFFFGSCFIFTLRDIIRSSRGLWRMMLVVAVVFLALRLYGQNFLSYPLFYFAIMPNGLALYIANLNCRTRSVLPCQER